MDCLLKKSCKYTSSENKTILVMNTPALQIVQNVEVKILFHLTQR